MISIAFLVKNYESKKLFKQIFFHKQTYKSSGILNSYVNRNDDVKIRVENKKLFLTRDSLVVNSDAPNDEKFSDEKLCELIECESVEDRVLESNVNVDNLDEMFDLLF